MQENRQTEIISYLNSIDKLFSENDSNSSNLGHLHKKIVETINWID